MPIQPSIYVSISPCLPSNWFSARSLFLSVYPLLLETLWAVIQIDSRRTGREGGVPEWRMSMQIAVDMEK